MDGKRQNHRLPDKMSGSEAQRPKRVPVRTCVVCKNKAGKRALYRLVRTEHGIQVDLSGKLNGRGAYLCERESCWERAMTTDSLNKALRTTLTLEDVEHLRQFKPSS